MTFDIAFDAPPCIFTMLPHQNAAGISTGTIYLKLCVQTTGCLKQNNISGRMSAAAKIQRAIFSGLFPLSFILTHVYLPFG